MCVELTNQWNWSHSVASVENNICVVKFDLYILYATSENPPMHTQKDTIDMIRSNRWKLHDKFIVPVENREWLLALNGIDMIKFTITSVYMGSKIAQQNLIASFNAPFSKYEATFFFL